MFGVVLELSSLEHLKAVPPSMTQSCSSNWIHNLSQNREQLKELHRSFAHLEKVSLIFSSFSVVCNPC